MTVKIITIVTVPDALAHDWLQHLRDFDDRNPGCHFEVLADAPEMSVTEIIEAITLNPKLSFVDFVRRRRK